MQRIEWKVRPSGEKWSVPLILAGINASYHDIDLFCYASGDGGGSKGGGGGSKGGGGALYYLFMNTFSAIQEFTLSTDSAALFGNSQNAHQFADCLAF